MDQAETYYKSYLDANGYTMAKFQKTSRVSFLVDFVRKYTKPGQKVLDVGCGDMLLSELMPEFQWTGIDVNTMQSKGKAIEHNLESAPYPFEAESFDTIVCSEVLEHLFNPKIVTSEIRRIIKPTGTYILSTPNFHQLDHYLQFFGQLEADLGKPWTYEHIRQYSLDSHKQIMDGKFQVVEFTGADAHYSLFYSQGRATLRSKLESLGLKDPDFIETDKLIGQMFPLHNHTIMAVTKPV